MVATLVMWPGPFEQTFVLPLPGACIENLCKIGAVVQDKKSFEILMDMQS